MSYSEQIMCYRCDAWNKTKISWSLMLILIFVHICPLDSGNEKKKHTQTSPHLHTGTIWGFCALLGWWNYPTVSNRLVFCVNMKKPMKTLITNKYIVSSFRQTNTLALSLEQKKLADAIRFDSISFHFCSVDFNVCSLCQLFYLLSCVFWIRFLFVYTWPAHLTIWALSTQYYTLFDSNSRDNLTQYYACMPANRTYFYSGDIIIIIVIVINNSQNMDRPCPIENLKIRK